MLQNFTNTHFTTNFTLQTYKAERQKHKAREHGTRSTQMKISTVKPGKKFLHSEITNRLKKLSHDHSFCFAFSRKKSENSSLFKKTLFKKVELLDKLFLLIVEKF